MTVDLNHGSGYIPSLALGEEINRRIDLALAEARAKEPRGTYLGASSLGDPCDHALGLLNGMFVELDGIEAIDDERIRAVITTEEGMLVGGKNERGKPHKLSIYAGHFLDHETLDPLRDERDWKIMKRSVEATFGWAITCHKAQGSQWENVVVFDDKWGRGRDQRSQWLYTAITRAENGLVILD